MAFFPPANGDSQPVFALDINNGPQTGQITAPALVQMAGPKLDFIALIVENASNQAIDLRNQLGNANGGGTGVFNPGVVNTINAAIQRTSTIAFYQVEDDTSGQISYGIYPSGAFANATDLGNVVAGLGTVTVTEEDGTTNSVDVSGSQSTNVGFKLATT
jgi:hypothetical protein